MKPTKSYPYSVVNVFTTEPLSANPFKLAFLQNAEQFGLQLHAKGSFTGGLRDRVGRFQLADGGSLLLDEVAEIPLDRTTRSRRARRMDAQLTLTSARRARLLRSRKRPGNEFLSRP